MKFFRKSRDAPKKEKRNADRRLEEFIRGVDLDYSTANNGVEVSELSAMQHGQRL